MKIPEAKIVLVGESFVGKTCTVIRYVNNTYVVPAITVQANYLAKIIDVDGKRLKLNIWDTTGEEKYRSLSTLFFRSAHGVLIFYDVTSRESFEKIGMWMKEVKEKSPEGVDVVLVGNKIDLESERQVSTEEGSECAELLGVPFFEISAKDGNFVAQPFNKLGELIVEKNLKMFEEHVDDSSDNQNVDISSTHKGENKYKSGCC